MWHHEVNYIAAKEIAAPRPRNDLTLEWNGRVYVSPLTYERKLLPLSPVYKDRENNLHRRKSFIPSSLGAPHQDRGLIRVTL